jgi:hypothetical protein
VLLNKEQKVKVCNAVPLWGNYILILKPGLKKSFETSFYKNFESAIPLPLRPKIDDPFPAGLIKYIFYSP